MHNIRNSVSCELPSIPISESFHWRHRLTALLFFLVERWCHVSFLQTVFREPQLQNPWIRWIFPMPGGDVRNWGPQRIPGVQKIEDAGHVFSQKSGGFGFDRFNLRVWNSFKRKQSILVGGIPAEIRAILSNWHASYCKLPGESQGHFFPLEIRSSLTCCYAHAHRISTFFLVIFWLPCIVNSSSSSAYFTFL